MAYIILLLVLVAITTPIVAQQSLLRSGPMVGHVDMREATIWLQTTSDAKVRIVYKDSASSKVYNSPTMNVDASMHHIVKLVCDSVEPGRTYMYDVFINDKKLSFAYPTVFRSQPVWKYRKNDPPTMTMMLGSCFYINEEEFDRPGAGYGSDYEILNAMHAKRPDVMLWLGDNTYLREADWNSRSGIFKRQAHTRATPLLQPLLASTAHYAIWDDHDYGPNDADRGWWGRQHALDAFTQFWSNPVFGATGAKDITGSFAMIDVDVFMCDDRSYRGPDNIRDSARPLLGEMQIRWLIDALATSTATFKIVAVGSQFLTDNMRKESFARMPVERQRIIDLITQANIKGVLFVSGDIHASELSKLDRAGTYPLYEFTCSSLTAGSNKDIANQPNTYRVAGTEYGEHNFGTITVSGAAKARTLRLAVHDKNGKEVWNRAISETELR